MTGSPEDPQRPAAPVRPGAVIAGFLVGTLGWLVVQILPLALPITSDYGTYRVVQFAVILTAIAVSAGLLASPRTRQAGAGLVLGAAAGVIIWAGLCIAFVRV